METIKKDYGSLTMHKGHIYEVGNEMSDEGLIFKDYEAFHTGKGICYVSEYGFQEIEEGIAELDEKYEDKESEEYLIAREKVILEVAETRATIIKQVRLEFAEDYMLTEAQIEDFAEDVFGLAEWAYISTYLAENFDMEDSIEYDEITGRGVFTDFQHEAIREGYTPKEYADRQLSYAELSELGEEFDAAFIVDENCEDDWSDKGLGTNARLAYIQERRTGMISGPEEFDCPARFRK